MWRSCRAASRRSRRGRCAPPRPARQAWSAARRWSPGGADRCQRWWHSPPTCRSRSWPWRIAVAHDEREDERDERHRDDGDRDRRRLARGALAMRATSTGRSPWGSPAGPVGARLTAATCAVVPRSRLGGQAGLIGRAQRQRTQHGDCCPRARHLSLSDGPVDRRVNQASADGAIAPANGGSRTRKSGPRPTCDPAACACPPPPPADAAALLGDQGNVGVRYGRSCGHAIGPRFTRRRRSPGVAGGRGPSPGSSGSCPLRRRACSRGGSASRRG